MAGLSQSLVDPYYHKYRLQNRNALFNAPSAIGEGSQLSETYCGREDCDIVLKEPPSERISHPKTDGYKE